MNKQKLHLLILEDNPDDAELMVRELKKEGFEFEWKRVETEKAFKEALSKKPDIILADYKLPTFDGMAAIKLQQEISPDIPLIIVSGSIGEELAIDCLKAGATDYILKDRLSRLGHSMKRGLKEAEERKKLKKAEETLKESEKKYRTLVESLEEGIASVDENENFTFINPAACNIFGYAKEELLQMNFNDILTLENHQKITQQNSIRKTGKSSKYDLNIIKKNGDIRIITSSVSPIFKNGEFKGSFGIFYDITERKQAEEQLKKKNEELTAFNRLAVGRELRMIELKSDINKLLMKLGQEEKYKIVE
jgi:two-component system sensor kinase